MLEWKKLDKTLTPRSKKWSTLISLFKFLFNIWCVKAYKYWLYYVSHLLFGWYFLSGGVRILKYHIYIYSSLVFFFFLFYKIRKILLFSYVIKFWCLNLINSNKNLKLRLNQRGACGNHDGICGVNLRICWYVEIDML